MLRLLDITKEYKVDEDSVLALHGVSIEFRKNEFVSILGPSGCGKTTLLNIIGGLDRYTSGDIQIDGISTKEYDDVDWDTYRNRRIGFVFQSYNLIPHMNVLKNVSMSLVLAGVSKEERIARAMEALKKVGLETQAKKRPNQLSGGQMQRVAIARALVNNPEIILADEPTGALDTESGIQIMDLLKEVAEDRLVIMVTHNPQLAEEYSTRIVSLKDGEVIDDTMPFDPSQEPENVEVSAESDNVSSDSSQLEEVKEKNVVKRVTKWAAKRLKRKNAEKSSMKLKTAINLSWTNLLSKKGRTLLTSIAGSIGIIGIVMVLALSNGATKYISALEESALSTYPLTISRTNLELGTIMNLLMEDTSDKPKYPDSDDIYVSQVLGKLIGNITDLIADNDLKSLKLYMEKHKAELDEIGYVRYTYGTSFKVLTPDPISPDEKYMMTHPYSEVMMSVLSDVSADPTFGSMLEGEIFNGMTATEMLASMGGMLNSWSEMSANQALLDSQYELVGGTWPKEPTDIVVIVDSKNQLIDYQLFMLGLKSEDEVLEAMKESTFATTEYKVQDLLDLEYTLVTDSAYLDKHTDASGNEYWTPHNMKDKSTSYINSIDDAYKLTCHVSGVIRPKPGVTSLSLLNSVVGYTGELTELILKTSSQHPAIKAMIDEYYETKASLGEKYAYATSTIDISDEVLHGTPINSTELLEDILVYFGAALDYDNPAAIEVYCSSFEGKEKFNQFLKKYNESHEQEIKYSDSLSVIMGFVNTLTNTITGVLVAFAAISLIVSTIMIAIIVYTSVLERKKEIGVLRSIGARKKDVSRVFIAESGILGAYSGLIGVFISYILSFLVSFILKTKFEIDGLMTVSWWHALMMFLISIFLSVLAGFVPSRIAAKKDPAIALRSE